MLNIKTKVSMEVTHTMLFAPDSSNAATNSRSNSKGNHYAELS
ncbi:rCG63588 [Rattus norvegicus]|uniref:RCG63588 n=1 Tax=Rattus norvegicus TaxID=10116 RepID=A6I5S5_RAT|nr:rCG63588 [Rattus norvegicus]